MVRAVDARPIRDPELREEDERIIQALLDLFEPSGNSLVESKRLLAVAAKVTGRPPRAHERRLRYIMSEAFPRATRKNAWHPITRRRRRVWLGVRRRRQRRLFP